MKNPLESPSNNESLDTAKLDLIPDKDLLAAIEELESPIKQRAQEINDELNGLNGLSPSDGVEMLETVIYDRGILNTELKNLTTQMGAITMYLKYRNDKWEMENQ